MQGRASKTSGTCGPLSQMYLEPRTSQPPPERGSSSDGGGGRGMGSGDTQHTHPSVRLRGRLKRCRATSCLRWHVGCLRTIIYRKASTPSLAPSSRGARRDRLDTLDTPHCVHTCLRTGSAVQRDSPGGRFSNSLIYEMANVK